MLREKEEENERDDVLALPSKEDEEEKEANFYCTSLAIERSADKCTHVQKYECNADTESMIANYLYFHHCTMKEYQSLSVFTLIGVVILSFYVLGDTAEEFFCPALSVISDTLSLSHNVAGVTFLAFGNGAPDIFSVYASIKQGGEGTKLAVGELYGAGSLSRQQWWARSRSPSLSH